MNAPALARQVFKTSRLAEFCSQKELVNQTGHAIDNWPLVVLKELVDNALDGAEEVGIAPVIEIKVTDDGISVTDNGPGIAPETVAGILDYHSRTSSREAYASPTRGAQGNALKTILAMPFALDGECGQTTIESQGVAHRIEFSIDHLRQIPRIARVCEAGSVKNGTRVTVRWPNSESSILGQARHRFLPIACGYTWVNPHLTLSVHWHVVDVDPIQWTIAATNPTWTKYRPLDPTSPHWYDEATLSRLMAAHIAHAEDHGQICPTVRDFVGEFRGLSGTAKRGAICKAIDASRASLADFYSDGNNDRIAKLLAEMRKASRPVKPKDLGAIGKDHLAAKFESLGVAPETFEYRRAEFEHEDIPYLAEAAFGYCPKGLETRRIVTGVNWSVAIGSSPFRRLGAGGESLDSILTMQRAGRDEPIITVLHLVCPRIEYLDRGKSSVAIPGSRAW